MRCATGLFLRVITPPLRGRSYSCALAVAVQRSIRCSRASGRRTRERGRCMEVLPRRTDGELAVPRLACCHCRSCCPPSPGQTGPGPWCARAPPPRAGRTGQLFDAVGRVSVFVLRVDGACLGLLQRLEVPGKRSADAHHPRAKTFTVGPPMHRPPPLAPARWPPRPSWGTDAQLKPGSARCSQLAHGRGASGGQAAVLRRTHPGHVRRAEWAPWRDKDSGARAQLGLHPSHSQDLLTD